MNVKNCFRNFVNNDEGIVLVGILVIVWLVASSLIGIIGALIVNKVADALTPFLGSAPQALVVVTNARNAYIVGIVLVDVCLLIYLFVSAQKRESQEQQIPDGVFF